MIMKQHVLHVVSIEIGNHGKVKLFESFWGTFYERSLIIFVIAFKQKPFSANT